MRWANVTRLYLIEAVLGPDERRFERLWRQRLQLVAATATCDDNNA